MASTPQWRCLRSGECCRHITAVVMTDAEKVRVEHAAPFNVDLFWTALPDGKWSLQAKPCPLLTADGQCGIYADRPYNCRRWGCFRPTTSTSLAETPFKTLPEGNVVPIGFGTDKALTRQVLRLEAQAKPWGLAHGWGATEDLR
jgi:hypothetical protein